MKALNWLKSNGESIGIPIFITGLFLIVIVGIISIFWKPQLEALSVVLALFSAGLGLIAIGSAHKHDVEMASILERVESKLPFREGIDKISEPLVVTTKPIVAKTGVATPSITTKGQTKEKAQRRLDDDTKKVGYLRGELYQVNDGSWAIHWGGKYPL